jgi:predicted signal transduction protein with EAL and GGDEF domain
LSVTISLGVAERTERMRCPEDLLKAADEALYAAKAAGRNQVCVAGKSIGSQEQVRATTPAEPVHSEATR